MTPVSRLGILDFFSLSDCRNLFRPVSLGFSCYLSLTSISRNLARDVPVLFKQLTEHCRFGLGLFCVVYTFTYHDSSCLMRVRRLSLTVHCCLLDIRRGALLNAQATSGRSKGWQGVAAATPIKNTATPIFF